MKTGVLFDLIIERDFNLLCKNFNYEVISQMKKLNQFQ
jgi:hypothetical protein